MKNNSKKAVCLVVGAGDDTGAAIAKTFAADGFKACIVRRPRHIDKLHSLADEIINQGGEAYPFGVDARDETQMVEMIEKIESEIGPIEVVVFNIGANVRFSITETTSQVYRKVWEMACFAGFLTGREVSKRMLLRKRGTIIFTGATASMRGSEGFSAFSGAKFALRALAQSMARELGPSNIHVIHSIIDGPINSTFIRENLPNVDQMLENDALLAPMEIAKNYLNLHKQARTAWTHEIDLRPWSEKW
ncbi:MULTISPECIES: SDR family oxidoreductase [unclassified Colwellia]|uniref:SDR family oxidoreductase n=1 Tax=unclassified Colwellia TaxID=196834 RepID=UPI0015F584E1|nr:MULTISPECIES: SDR family oxidoreductase [unclassified Colwellia]MBA6288927.1 SDR family oxidoreductase [Colwellia sp. MB3u-4]MBA6294594.1 SDR family oxidoreductase [Colwellia sp. MB02u-9]